MTTYTAGETGEFTLTIGGLPAAVTLTPTPEPDSYTDPIAYCDARTHTYGCG